MDTEIWKDINDYYGKYQISNYGNVKSLHCNKERIMKLQINSHGYYSIRLCLNSKYTNNQIHQLVAIHFLNHTPNKHNIVVDHIDNNKLNNYYLNLQLVTNRYNTTKDKSSNTGFTGVTKYKNYYKVSIRFKNKSYHLGNVKSPEEGHKLYLIAKSQIEQNIFPIK